MAPIPAMVPRSARVFLLPLLLAASLAASPARRPEEPVEIAATGPLTGDFADPFVLREGDAYYAYATGTNAQHLQLARSTDLERWTRLEDPLPTLPRWAVPATHLTWAPSVVRRGDRWVLYYTTADQVSGFQCIGRAVAASPEGPFVDETERPLVCQAGAGENLCGSIDPSPFVDADGQLFLLWKSDENASACRGNARLWSQALTPDGRSLAGAAVPLLTTDRPWETPLVEGPSMVRDGDDLHLFYSANWYDSASYAIGHARCEGPLGPCTKTSVARPWLRSEGPILGPGGQELFHDVRGELWMAYHAWTAPAASYGSGGARSLRLARVVFDAGRPKLLPPAR